MASTAESPGPDHVLSTEAHPSAASSCAAREWLPGAARWRAPPFLVVIVMGAMLPPRHFDVREYHLEVPKEWYQQGRIDFVAHNVYGNMPLGAEMHALLGMILMRGERDWWWGALAGKTVIAMFAPLTMLALVAAGRRFFSVSAGVVAGLVYISTGWVAHVSMAGLIDGAVGCYLLLALYAVLIWSQQDAERAPDGRATGETRRREEPEGTGGWRRAARGRLLLAGFLAGSAVACKYPAVLFVAIPLAAWVLARGQHWRPFAVFLLALACGCGPWFGKNWVLAGNPTYPLLYEVFGGRTWTAEKSAQWRSAHAVPKDAHGRRYALPQLGAAAADVLLTSKWLSPLLIPLAALSLVLRRRRRMVLALLGMYLYIIAAWWLLTHRIDRFWIPVLPIVALLAGAGATWTAAWLWGRALIAVLFWGLLSNLLVIGSPAVGDVRFLVALEQLRLDLPHDRDPLPSRVNPAHRYLNEAVPDGFGVLLVGDAQPFDLEVPVLYNTCFDDCVLEKLMKGRSAAERRAILGRHKISHVYVDWPELRRYRSPGNYGYAAGSNFVQPALFDELVAQGVLGKPLVLSSAGSPSGARPPQIFPVAGPTRKAGRS